ncbi:MAG: hypothetical protein LBH74_04410 [Nitrososphaerota archaeon]|nr:hypothetical protein [Nitrososphaerota archaeon]
MSFRSKQFLIAISLVLIIALAMMIVPQRASAQGDTQQQQQQYFEKLFVWDYDGRHWTWNLSIPSALYDAYRAVSVSVRVKNGPAGYGYLTTTQDYYVQMLAQKLDDAAAQMGYNDYDRVSFVLAFVQHLPYTSDLVTTGYDEYPRFPIETLVDDGGDCEDVAILFASLMLVMGYGVVYINPPNHYAVGILGDNLKGTYWTYPKDSNQTYYFCETTGVNFKIGQLPQEFSGQKVHIYPIDESKQFVPSIALMPPTVEPVPTQTVAPTFNPNPTDASPPVVPDPIAQPVLPLSFNLIVENPVLFAFIILAIAASMVTAVMSTRRRHLPHASTASTSPDSQLLIETTQSVEKFCSSCGAANKGYAVFCEKCGKQISNN